MTTANEAMTDNEHILKWWSEKGQETLKVEWASRFLRSAHLRFISDAGPAYEWVVDVGEGVSWDCISRHQAACLIRDALVVSLALWGLWTTPAYDGDQLAGYDLHGADGFMAHCDTEGAALTAGWDVVVEMT
ncbi:hypothetical protein LCGC14_3021690 [marine sediment metagenome]|uniref:Uncharacterized protein n=1 Tax=marine sediment metagenome TaxID=412755 RepID=A0A0F8WVJ5_9ZZZZ